MKNFLKKRKKLYRFLLNIREKLRIIYNTKTRSRFFWNLRRGDNTLSLDYPLNENSIVFDVGAYKGIFTEKVYNFFNCYVYAFEPLEKYFELLSNKFINNEKVNLYNFGFLDADSTQNLSNIDGSSSIYTRDEGELELKVEMRSFSNFVIKNSFKKIDLLYVNIEGSEYRLLDEIIKSGYINNIKHLQVQFHNFVDGSKKMRKEIRNELRKTHVCIFNFPFIWERWDLKQ
tara:strand:+ start:1545 stop:2234 length:690 start_codon:yes stop_codon:yes gene_type:complete